MLCDCCSTSEEFSKFETTRVSKGSNPEILKVTTMATYKIDTLAALEHLNIQGLQDKEMSWKAIEGEFVQILRAGRCHWLSPGALCIYDSAPGMVTPNVMVQVAAIMYSKEYKLITETMAVDQQVILAFMRLPQHMNSVLAMTLLTSSGNMTNFASTCLVPWRGNE